MVPGTDFTRRGSGVERPRADERPTVRQLVPTGIEWSRYEPVSRRLIVFCIVVYDSLLHVRQWFLGMSPASVGMFGPYYDEFWTTIWILAALLLASSIRRELHAG